MQKSEVKQTNGPQDLHDRRTISHSTYLKYDNMKKSILLIIAFALMPFFAKAQEVTTKTRDLGFNFTGSQFGVRYTTGNDKTLLRMTLLSLYGTTNWNQTETNKSSSNQQGVGFNIGFEKRKAIAENISFYLGSDLLTSFDSYTGKNESSDDAYKNSTISAGVGFVMGVNFKITERMNISTEIVPAVYYSHTQNESQTQFGDTESTSNGLNYGLSTKGINVTMSFSLNKKKQE